jgi:hypothetical protein
VESTEVQVQGLDDDLRTRHLLTASLGLLQATFTFCPRATHVGNLGERLSTMQCAGIG